MTNQIQITQSHLTSFKQHLTTNNKSPNTINSYLLDINQYLSHFTTLSRENIQQYKQILKQNFSTESYNRKLSSLKQLNEYLHLPEINILPEVYIIKTDFIKQQYKGNPTHVSEKEVLQFLERVKNKPSTHQSRNIAIIYLMANTAIRREECANLKLSNIINGSKSKLLKFIGKGNKERTVVLNNTAIKVIDNYLIDRAKSKYVNSEYLFLSERGDKLTKTSINGIFDFYCTPIKFKITPHALRHNWCSTMLEKGIYDIIEVKDQAGHSSLTTTEIYTHARLDSMEEKANRYSIGGI
jgi:site-specific recombinase XerD